MQQFFHLVQRMWFSSRELAVSSQRPTSICGTGIKMLVHYCIAQGNEIRLLKNTYIFTLITTLFTITEIKTQPKCHRQNKFSDLLSMKAMEYYPTHEK